MEEASDLLGVISRPKDLSPLALVLDFCEINLPLPLSILYSLPGTWEEETETLRSWILKGSSFPGAAE